MFNKIQKFSVKKNAFENVVCDGDLGQASMHE